MYILHIVEAIKQIVPRAVYLHRYDFLPQTLCSLKEFKIKY